MIFDNKKGFIILRVVIAIFVGVALLVCLTVLHPLVQAMVNTFLATSTDSIQNFGVRMIPIFYVLIVFLAMIITMATGE